MNNNQNKHLNWKKVKLEDLHFNVHDKFGKLQITTTLTGNGDVAVVTPACITQWPRVVGDGNFGTMWGPDDITKAKFQLDLTDAFINNTANPDWEAFAALLTGIDNKLLDFVCNPDNQTRLLGRRNLSREEVKMLQIPSVKAKYDKMSGNLIGHSVQLNAPKFIFDGMGGKMARDINIVDFSGKAIEKPAVAPGDCVAATCHIGQVYTGVGGDKFGISWALDAVSIVAQRSQLSQAKDLDCFQQSSYTFATPYVPPQVSEPMSVS